MVSCPAVGLQRCLRPWGEEHIELAFTSEVAVEVGRQQRSGRVFDVADLPSGTWPDQQPLTVDVEVCVLRDVDAGEFAGLGQHELLAGVETHPLADHIAGEARRRIAVGVDDHVVVSALVDRDRLAQRRATMPALDDPWVAGRGERAGTEVGADVDRVLVDPADIALGLREHETVDHELLRE